MERKHILRNILFYLAITVAAVASIIIGVILAVNPPLSLTFSEGFVQQKLDKKLPWVLPTKAKVSVTIHEGATLKLQPDGTVLVKAAFAAKPTFTKSTHYRGELEGKATLFYNKEKGAFFTQNSEITSLNGEIVGSERLHKLKLDTLLNKAVKKLNVSPDEAESNAISREIRDTLEDWLLNKLDKTPFPMPKGKTLWDRLVFTFAGETLENVHIGDQSVTATVHLQHVLFLLILAICAVVVAGLVTWALFQSGVAAALLQNGEVLGAIFEVIGEMATFS